MERIHRSCKLDASKFLDTGLDMTWTIMESKRPRADQSGECDLDTLPYQPRTGLQQHSCSSCFNRPGVSFHTFLSKYRSSAIKLFCDGWGLLLLLRQFHWAGLAAGGVRRATVQAPADRALPAAHTYSTSSEPPRLLGFSSPSCLRRGGGLVGLSQERRDQIRLRSPS